MAHPIPTLTEGLATRFAAIALGHVRRDYPHKLDHVITGPGEVPAPAALHPVFFGSFDWHSCVHAYWMLARLQKLFPALPQSAAITALFADQLTDAKIAAECAYFANPAAAGFERPYGWAWLLKLATALRDLPDPAWADRLAPLAAIILDRLHAWLPRMDYPIRAGTHANTAFALLLVADYATATGHAALLETLRGKAADWYGLDADCQAWEPSGDDFLSSALTEAVCMQRLLPAAQFTPWFARFLPRLADAEPATLFTPAQVSDRSDGKIAHLDGLNLSRGWCWQLLAGTLPAGDRRHSTMQDTATRHLQAALPHIAATYAGEHWLATFAVLALDDTNRRTL